MRPKKAILLVDANEDRLGRCRFLLETHGYRVISASSSYAALEYLETPAMVPPDLLLVDLLLPGMDGNELVRRGKALHPLLPALLVSDAVASEHDRAPAANAFLPRCATMYRLLETVRDLVARKRGPRPHVLAQAQPAGTVAT